MGVVVFLKAGVMGVGNVSAVRNEGEKPECHREIKEVGLRLYHFWTTTKSHLCLMSECLEKISNSKCPRAMTEKM